jgi:glycine/D-amino acid oxidase-like deaminating enzyme
VTFGSTSETSTEMRKYTRDLYARLEAETGVDTGFKPVGFIEVAATRTASRSTAACPRSTATAASTCTRSRPRR